MPRVSGLESADCRWQLRDSRCGGPDHGGRLSGGGGAAVAPTDRGGHVAGSREKRDSIAKDNLETFLVTNESVDVSK